MAVDDSGARREERAGSANLRFEGLQTRSTDPLYLLNSIAFRALHQVIEVDVLARGRRHDKFATLTVRDASFRAVAIQHTAPAHAKPGFETFGFVINPRVNDFAVAR